MVSVHDRYVENSGEMTKYGWVYHMALYYHEIGMDDMTIPAIISFEEDVPEGWIPVYCNQKGKEYKKPLFYGTATVEEILDIIESIHPEYAIYAGEEPDRLRSCASHPFKPSR